MEMYGISQVLSVKSKLKILGFHLRYFRHTLRLPLERVINKLAAAGGWQHNALFDAEHALQVRRKLAEQAAAAGRGYVFYVYQRFFHKNLRFAPLRRASGFFRLEQSHTVTKMNISTISFSFQGDCKGKFAL
jgi:hypothetical protein